MSGAPFFQTRMGQRFYEHTMPELVRQLTRLNDLLETAAVQPDRPERTDDHGREPRKKT
jgi:hypothetical protein